MDRSQITGALIMAGAALEFLVFLYGVLRRSYVAVALPVLAGVGAISALAFWVGWTMLTTEPEVTVPEMEESTPRG